MKELDKAISKVDDIASKELVRIARDVLRRNNKTYEFVIAMGTYFFTNIEGEIIKDCSINHKRLDNFINKYQYLHLTGIGYRFTLEGEITTDW